jgi:hypothetical protein
MKHLLIFIFIFCSLFMQNCTKSTGQFRHTIVAAEKGKFHGWPANNGAWIWGDEILVGFTQVEYEETSGHNIKDNSPQLSLMTRSTDGGVSWQMFDPSHYVGDFEEKTILTEPVNFTQKDFAMRIFGTAYHGTNDPEGGFFYSYDRGNSWIGPFALGSISEHSEFEGMDLTPRTDYVVMDKNTCLIFVSARIPDTGMSDKIACIKTIDGGLSFEFVSWVVPLSDPHRAVMPQTVKINSNELLTAVRRRVIDNSDSCWIDAYHSTDQGASWQFLNRVGVTGKHNGNPPALVRMKDGRLCCVYGNRTKRQIIGRYSLDNGKSWQDEFVIRSNFYTGEDGQDMKDLGYPRIVQSSDGKLVAFYYWATKENPQQHIAATIWKP